MLIGQESTSLRNLSIPVIGNGDVLDYDDGIKRLENLNGFMIGRACFGNPWCFLPGGYIPTLEEIPHDYARAWTTLG